MTLDNFFSFHLLRSGVTREDREHPVKLNFQTENKHISFSISGNPTQEWRDVPRAPTVTMRVYLGDGRESSGEGQCALYTYGNSSALEFQHRRVYKCTLPLPSCSSTLSSLTRFVLTHWLQKRTSLGKSTLFLFDQWRNQGTEKLSILPKARQHFHCGVLPFNMRRLLCVSVPPDWGGSSGALLLSFGF